MTSEARSRDSGTNQVPVAEKVYLWGKALLVLAAIAGGAITFASKTVSAVKAGPEAIEKTEALDKRLTHVEAQTKFLVRGMEKLTKTHYIEETE